MLTLVIQEQDPTCRARTIIDDRNVRTNTCDQLDSVLTESAHFDELRGLSVNISKTVVFSTSVKGCKQLSKLRVFGVPFKQSHVVKAHRRMRTLKTVSESIFVKDHYQIGEVLVWRQVHGPVQHLRTAMYLDMGDHVIYSHPPCRTCPLRERVRQSLVADVQTRATREQPDRKDIQDLTTQLDFDASCALLLG